MYVTAWSTKVFLVRVSLSDSRMLTAVDGISLLVRNLNAEFFFNRHHHLDCVQAVQTQVILEMRCSRNLPVTG